MVGEPVTFPLWFGKQSDGKGAEDTAPRLAVVRAEAGPNVQEAGDRALVSRIRKNDVAAYETLYRTYFTRLRAVAVSYVRAIDQATDIVSDVFTRVWERRSGWDPPNVEAYLIGAVRNRALNVLRDRQRADARERALIAEGVSPGAGQPDVAIDAQLEQRDVRRMLRDAVTRLSERQRMILALRWHQQMDWPAISVALGISVAAARTDHSRALRTLRGLLGEGEE